MHREELHDACRHRADEVVSGTAECFVSIVSRISLRAFRRYTHACTIAADAWTMRLSLGRIWPTRSVLSRVEAMVISPTCDSDFTTVVYVSCSSADSQTSLIR